MTGIPLELEAVVASILAMTTFTITFIIVLFGVEIVCKMKNKK